jgi:REP element-mobilizing transposase RayT
VAHTYVSALFHCVFSTKERRGLIPSAKQPDVWSYLGRIARKNGFKLLAAGGTDNHVHLLVSLPATVPLAKAMQLLKGGSSKWMNDSGANGFAWQEGYGAFSVGVSQLHATITYINSQAEHHHKHGFEEEFLAFLHKHGIAYDTKYVWG